MSNAEIEIVRRGVVAVIPRHDRLLVIRRSQFVLAPGYYCFPGGGIEGTESEEEALVRELHEELGVVVRPVRRLWDNVTSWKISLAWWLAELPEGIEPVHNPLEVEAFHWQTPSEMAALPNLLESNAEFLHLLLAGRIELR